MTQVRKMVGRKFVTLEVPSKIVNQTVQMEIAFRLFKDPSEIRPGMAVVLKSEVEQASTCPFASMIVESIVPGANEGDKIYVLARPWLHLGPEGLEMKTERVRIHSFERMSLSFYAYVTGPDGKPYVLEG